MPDVGLSTHTLIRIWGITISPTYIPNILVRAHISEPTWDYWVGSNTICNNPRTSASHICAYIPKGLVRLQLGLLAIFNKTQFDPVYARCGTQRTHTYQNLGHHIRSSQELRFQLDYQTCFTFKSRHIPFSPKSPHQTWRNSPPNFSICLFAT